MKPTPPRDLDQNELAAVPSDGDTSDSDCDSDASDDSFQSGHTELATDTARPSYGTPEFKNVFIDACLARGADLDTAHAAFTRFQLTQPPVVDGVANVRESDERNAATATGEDDLSAAVGLLSLQQLSPPNATPTLQLPGSPKCLVLDHMENYGGKYVASWHAREDGTISAAPPSAPTHLPSPASSAPSPIPSLTHDQSSSPSPSAEQQPSSVSPASKHKSQLSLSGGYNATLGRLFGTPSPPAQQQPSLSRSFAPAAAQPFPPSTYGTPPIPSAYGAFPPTAFGGAPYDLGFGGGQDAGALPSDMLLDETAYPLYDNTTTGGIDSTLFPAPLDAYPSPDIQYATIAPSALQPQQQQQAQLFQQAPTPPVHPASQFTPYTSHPPPLAPAPTPAAPTTISTTTDIKPKKKRAPRATASSHPSRAPDKFPSASFKAWFVFEDHYTLEPDGAWQCKDLACVRHNAPGSGAKRKIGHYRGAQATFRLAAMKHTGGDMFAFIKENVPDQTVQTPSSYAGSSTADDLTDSTTSQRNFSGTRSNGDSSHTFSSSSSGSPLPHLSSIAPWKIEDDYFWVPEESSFHCRACPARVGQTGGRREGIYKALGEFNCSSITTRARQHAEKHRAGASPPATVPGYNYEPPVQSYYQAPPETYSQEQQQPTLFPQQQFTFDTYQADPSAYAPPAQGAWPQQTDGSNPSWGYQ
ncbi:hypothetical protein RQP46_009810 [Phenoliferia psychrophenolica]